jgi:hypothetical protein
MSSAWPPAALSASDGRNGGTLSQELSELENERDQDQRQEDEDDDGGGWAHRIEISPTRRSPRGKGASSRRVTDAPLV